MIEILKKEAIELLKELIKIPSFSKEEDKTANYIETYIQSKSYITNRIGNNIWTQSKHFDTKKPTILLNSHHDTVKANKAWTYNPFEAKEEGGKIIGLGSNDAGASLVSLLATFLFLDSKKDNNYNLIFAASAEEEISGNNGAELLLKHLGKIDLGIVGEPTQMQMAIAEKGLLVIDGVAKGKAGHAARNEGINAIYKAIDDINWFRSYSFPNKTNLLGPVKMTVSIINAGKQHNVVPNECTFTVDVRTNECYSNKEVFDIIQSNVNSELTARSFRLNSSYIDVSHPIVKKGETIGMAKYGSPTMSDQVFMKKFPTIKIGPGDSSRSHVADEYINISEIEYGIDKYIQLLDGLRL